MSIKILTANSIENTNIDGARANNFNAGRRSGIVKGVLNEGRFFASSSNVIALDTCELRLCGHRVVIDSIQAQTFTNIPSSSIRYSYVAHLSVEAGGAVSFLLNTQTSSTALVQDNLDQSGIGVYELEIGKFTLNTSGEIEDVVRTADLITGGIGNQDGGTINIGTVTTNTLAEGLDAEVDVENRYNQSDNKTYTDFSFSIPQGETGEDGEDALVAKFVLTQQVPPTAGFNIDVPTGGFDRMPVVGEKFWIVQDIYGSSASSWTDDPNSDPILYFFEINSVSSPISSSYLCRVNVSSVYSRKIKGPKGAKGDKGDTGATGPQGPQGTSVAITTTSGSESISDGTNTLNFGSNAFNSTSFLPTAGGTMTGIITSNAGSGIRLKTKITSNNTVVDSNKFLIYGSEGASSSLYTQITDAADGNANYYKLMDSNGTLYSKGAEVLTTEGGTITKPIILGGGDTASSGKIILDAATAGQITNNGNAALLGFASNNTDTLTVGAGSFKLALRGYGTRPKFNSNDLALLSDVTTTPSNILNTVYPVGSIYITVSTSTTGTNSPASVLGGTWERLPDGYTLWTASSGAYDGTNGTIAAGLPNIKASWYIPNMLRFGSSPGTVTASGANSISESSNGKHAGAGDSQTAWHITNNFNANSYNSIYNDNTSTVQPPAIKVYMWRRTA